MNRFYISPEEFKKDIITIKGEDFKHLSKVLRLQIDDEIEIYNGNNKKAQGIIKEFDNNSVKVCINNKEQVFSENQNSDITLFQGVPKKGKLETIIQKATELGINTLYPFYSKRSIVKPSKSDNKKQIRYQRIANEAAKQCGRGVIPVIKPFQNFNDLKSLLENYDVILLAYEEEKDKTLKQVLNNISKKISPVKIALIIGPEGGFDESEIKELQSNLPVEIITLGNRILRTETAGIATISQLNFFFENE